MRARNSCYEELLELSVREIWKKKMWYGEDKVWCCLFFFFQAEDGIRDLTVTGVQTCALPIFRAALALDASPVVVVVGYQAESVTEELGRQFAGAPIRFALQAEQLGTGHAVLCADRKSVV